MYRDILCDRRFVQIFIDNVQKLVMQEKVHERGKLSSG